jgi:hypothetical protein
MFKARLARELYVLTIEAEDTHVSIHSFMNEAPGSTRISRSCESDIFMTKAHGG